MRAPASSATAVFAVVLALPGCLVVCLTTVLVTGGILAPQRFLPFTAESLAEAAASEDFGEARLRLGQGEDPARRVLVRLSDDRQATISALEGAVFSAHTAMVDLFDRFAPMDPATVHALRCFAEGIDGPSRDSGMIRYLTERDSVQGPCDGAPPP